VPLGGAGLTQYDTLALFLPSMQPGGSVSSGISLVSGGISQTIQCVKLPEGASGSRTIKAKLLDLVGTLSIKSGGFILSTYFAGIGCPLSKAVLDIFIGVLLFIIQKYICSPKYISIKFHN
jgi:hypothetical protein